MEPTRWNRRDVLGGISAMAGTGILAASVRPATAQQVKYSRRLDRFWLPVGDWQKSRDWYRRHLGFEVEFEIPDRKTAAMRAGAYLTMVLFEGEVLPCPGISFAIPVDDVDAKYEELIAEGIPFIHPPLQVFWGYGAELCDPDGYRFRLWDEK